MSLTRLYLRCFSLRAQTHAMHTDEYSLSPFACLLGGPYLGPISLLSELQRFVPQKYNSETVLPHNTFSTWLVEGEIQYTLFCVKDPLNDNCSVMVLYDQESDSLFYLRRELWPRNIPVDTVVLAHFIWDTVREGRKRPNFLLFDATYWGGKRLHGTDPCERYNLLRQIQIPENSMISVHFVGEKRTLQAFLDAVELPHKVKTVIALTSDPFKPWYE